MSLSLRVPSFRLHLPSAMVLGGYLTAAATVVAQNPGMVSTLLAKLGAAGAIAAPIVLAASSAIVQRAEGPTPLAPTPIAVPPIAGTAGAP